MKRITVNQAAEQLSASPQFVRLALQQNRLPIGTAVKGKRWIYLIYQELVDQYININREAEK